MTNSTDSRRLVGVENITTVSPSVRSCASVSLAPGGSGRSLGTSIGQAKSVAGAGAQVGGASTVGTASAVGAAAGSGEPPLHPVSATRQSASSELWQRMRRAYVRQRRAAAYARAMRRLLHVAQPTDGGVARCVADLAAAQLAEGVDVHVACPGGGVLEDELRRRGVPVHRWQASRNPGLGTAGEVRRLRAVVRTVAPELVHLHSAKAGLVGRLLLHGSLPTVFQPHAWSFEAVTGTVRRATLSWERAATRWTSLLVCVSDAERRRGVEAGVAVQRTAVVPNGVDLQALPAATPKDRAAARHELGLPDGPLAVCVGRLARQKGQDVLLAAWPEVRAAVPTAGLALVGDGPEGDALRAAGSPGVTLAGASAAVGSWLAAADVVVVPSRWEGMALVPLEAMARARSLVASDVTGMREAVPEGAGALVPPEDPRALAQALVVRLGGQVDADAEGRAGRAHVERAHDVRSTTARVTAAALSLLDAR